MNNLNSILLEGNLVRDPEVKATPKGALVCKFTLASNRFYRAEDNTFSKEVSYFDVETWGKLAETAGEKGKKGRGVRVVGRLKQNRWTDSDGRNHTRICIVAEHVEFRPQFVKETPPKNEEDLSEDDKIELSETEEEFAAVGEATVF